MFLSGVDQTIDPGFAQGFLVEIESLQRSTSAIAEIPIDTPA
jgi:hypothetical protein